MAHTILRIDASARTEGSITRDLADQTIARIAPQRVVVRDLAATPVPQIDAAWTRANLTPATDRSDDQRAILAHSDALIDEINQADTLVIGVPIYNFGVPSALKAWVDHVARAGVTFRYTQDGPKGLLTDKRAILVVASGGTQVGSDIDFATGYMKHVLGFIGIRDVSIIAADQMARNADLSMKAARTQIAALAA